MNSEKSRSFLAEQDDDNRRLDRIIRKMFPEIGLSRIYSMIRTGKIKLNGKKSAPSARVRRGDRIALDHWRKVTINPGIGRGIGQGGSRRRTGLQPDTGKKTDPSFRNAVPNSISIGQTVLLENRHFLALNKPAGIAVHGEDSLDTVIKDYLEERMEHSLSFHPGPVHRLDKGTSGILFFAKSLAGARYLSRLFKAGKIGKYYLALLDGRLAGPVTWRDAIGWNKRERRAGVGDIQKIGDNQKEGAKKGKSAVTHVHPVASQRGITLAVVQIETGRTHQIRAQASAHSHPLAGDSKYGGSSTIDRFFLHFGHCIIDGDIFDGDFGNMRLDRGASIPVRQLITAPIPPVALRMIVTLFGEQALREAENIVKKLTSNELKKEG